MALALVTPVEAVDKLACFAYVYVADGIRIAGAGIGVRVVDIVVGDVKALVAAVVDSGTHHPVVGLRAVDEFPTVDTATLKVADERQRCRGTGQSGKHQRGVLTVIASAVGADIDIICIAAVETGECDVSALCHQRIGSRARTRNKVYCIVFHYPRGGITVLNPANSGPVGTNAVKYKVGRFGAGGKIVNGKVINHKSVARAGSGSDTQSHTLAAASVATVIDSVRIVGARPVATRTGGELDSLDRYESGFLKHTGLKSEVGVHTRSIESEHQGIDVLHSGECGNLGLAGAALKLEIDIAVACIGLPYVCRREGAGATATGSHLLPAVGQSSCGQFLKSGAVGY